MDSEHLYQVEAWWTSGKTGIAKSTSAPNAIHFTAPPEFGGLAERWTPEDLLMASVASCFTTTFHAIASNSGFEYTDLSVDAQGIVRKSETGYGFSEIILRPTLTIPKEELRERAGTLLQKAKALCLVSRALSRHPKFEARIEVGKHALPRETHKSDLVRAGA